MKIYLSGYLSQKNYLWDRIKEIKYWLNAFSELFNRKNLEAELWLVEDMFLDSGWYSIRMRGLDLSLNDYIKYINKRWDKYTAIANMDTADVQETLNNHKILEKETGRKIIPVYHASDYFEWNKELFETYCKEYDYVAIWWVAWVKLSPARLINYLNFIFTTAIKYKTKIHWFGITSHKLLMKYPFYSVDSTSWLQWVKFNTITYFERWKLKKTQASNYRKRFGIDLAKLPYWEKCYRNLQSWLLYNDYITKLHKAKWMEYRN